MNKPRYLNILLIVLAILSVFLYAKIFLFSDYINKVKAQMLPPPTAAIDSPPEGTVLSGRHNFNIHIVPYTNINSVFITVPSYDNTEMYCELEHDGQGYWYGPCDTMDFENITTIGLEVRARDNANSEIILQGSGGGAPIFYFAIDNTYVVEAELPEDGNVGYGTVHLVGYLSGDAASAVFEIVSADDSANTYELSASKESGSYAESTWSAFWDASSVPAGSYNVYFSFTTLGGTVRQQVASTVVDICNPSWQCNEWSECSSSGTQTRTCTDINSCGVDYNQPPLEQTCTYVPPDEPPPPANSNTNTAPPPGEPSPPANQPLAQPVINYPESGSQTRDDQPTVTGQADPGKVVKVYLDNTFNGQTVSQSDGSYSYQLANPLPAGNHQIFTVAMAVDDESWVSIPSETIIFELLPPHVVMTIPKEGDVISGTVTLTGVVEGGISNLDFYYFPIDGGRINYLVGAGQPTSNNPSIWEKSWDTSDVPDGRQNVYAKVQDRVGSFYESNRVEVNIDHQLVPETPPSTPEEEVFTDTDNDSVPDNIESEIGTDPHSPDENLGSEEVTEIIDELVAEGQISQARAEAIKSDLQKVVFEQPIDSGILTPEKLKVEKVENFSPRIGKNNLIIRGVGPPNTYITLFIYSSPIVVTTKTDASGNFTYTLDKDLLDGEHEVYVTVTDETGKIKEKSSAFTFFVRRAQAVSEEEYLRGDVNVEDESTALISNYLLVAVVIVGVVIIILLAAYYLSRRKSQTT